MPLVAASHPGRRTLRLPSSALTRSYDWLRGSPTGLALLALATGVAAGIGAVVFRELIAGFTVLFTGSADFSATSGAAHPALPALGPWFIVAVPVLGGLLYGPLIDRFAHEARGHGVPEVMLAVAQEGGRIRPRVAVVKSLASAICLGAGGSVGREGPIVQIGSAVGSSIGQVLRLGEANMRLLVACGAAGGISATFNAPIAGVFFALELILRDYEVRSFGLVVLASVVADIISRAAFGNAPFLDLPVFRIASFWDYPLYVVLGILAAGAGILFIRSLYGADDIANRLWAGRPEWLRPVVGGLPLGVILLVLPQLYGVGYPPMETAVSGGFSIGLVLLLLGGKIVATSLTMAIGGSGGVFAPSLFIGGMLGTGFGVVLDQLAPGLVGPPGAYALVGMGAVFAAAARAPITSVLIIFELTGDYQIILPLMLAVAVAAGLSTVLSRDTIYTLKLRRRGIDIMRTPATDAMELITVREAMQPIPPPIPAGDLIRGFIDRFVGAGHEALPVVDETGAYRGIVTAQQVEGHMRDNDMEATAGSLARLLPTLAPDESLEGALTRLMGQESSGLPVVTREDAQVVGWLTHRDVLRAYADRLGLGHLTAPRTATAPPASRPALPGALRDYRLVDLEAGDGGMPAGQPIGELPWPAFCLPITVRRGDHSFRPGSGTVIEPGDVVTVLAANDLADSVLDLLVASWPGDDADHEGRPPVPEAGPEPESGQEPGAALEPDAVPVAPPEGGDLRRSG